MWMHFDKQAVGTRGEGCARHRSHLVPQSGSVTGIRDDRQMREPVYDGNRGQIEEIPRGGIEASHAPLAQYYVRVALRENVLRTQKKVGNRRRHSAFQQNG